MVGRSVVVLTVLAGALTACGGEDGTGQTMDAGLTCEDTTPLERPSFFGPCDDLYTGITWTGCTATATTAHADPQCETRACVIAQSECMVAAVKVARACAECRACPSAVIVRNCEIRCEETHQACARSASADVELRACADDAWTCENSCGLPAPGSPVGCPA
jgi:hypothetical protein